MEWILIGGIIVVLGCLIAFYPPLLLFLPFSVVIFLVICWIVGAGFDASRPVMLAVAIPAGIVGGLLWTTAELRSRGHR